MTYKPDSLQLHGIYATCASHALTATVAQEATQGWGDVQWLVVSVFHAQPQPMVRQLRCQTAMPNACKPCSAAGCALPVCCLRTRKRCSRQPMPFM